MTNSDSTINTCLKRKASQELRGALLKRSVARRSSTAATPILKRKATSDLQTPSAKRRASGFSDNAVEERSDNFVAPPTSATPRSILEVIPREIIYEIISWASIPASDAAGSSLYTLTRVSKEMANLALPEYIKYNKNILPRLTDFHMGLSRDTFNVFPAWTRSDMFPSRDHFICHFTLPNIDRKINALGIGLGSLRPALRPKLVTFEGDLNLTQGLSLLDIAGKARATTIDLEVYHLDWSARIVKDRMIHKLVQTVDLRIDWPSLSSREWRVLLSAISAPQLRALTLVGDVPWNALASFLFRHPTITKLHLPTSTIARVSQKYRALQMPKLLFLKGKLTNVVSFIKLLSRPSNLSIESSVPSNTPLIQTVHKIVDSLAICDSDTSLAATLTSTKPNGPLTQTRPFPVKTLKKWREFPKRLAHLTRLRLIVEGMEDSVLLYHCKKIMSVFPGLRHVTLRRNGDKGGWEWARIKRDVGASVTWDCMESSDYLESGSHYDYFTEMASE